MKRRTFAFQDADAGLYGEACCQIENDLLQLELALEERGLGVSSFEGSFVFDLTSLKCRLKRLAHRATTPGRCPDLSSRRWPTRPFRWMRKDCRYLGSLRATTPYGLTNGQTDRRMLLIAIVPRKNTQVLEVVIENTESSIHVPICFLEKLHQATAR
jgi:hypothetical protein